MSKYRKHPFSGNPYTLFIVLGSYFLFAFQGFALSAPPTVADRGFGQSLRAEIAQIRNDYFEGRISRPRANRRTATSFAKALSPGGLRFQREFPKGVHLDFMRDDISRIVNNALSGNKTNWHGFYRELKIINYIESPNSSFSLIESGSRQTISDGRLVEFDITTRHRQTGLKMVIESKDWGIRSRADLEKAKQQIAKIAIRAREEGVSRVAWINRKPVPEQFRGELLDFGKNKGAGIYDNISTGESAVRRGNARHISSILDKESRIITTRSGLRKATKGAVVFSIAFETGFLIHKTWQWRSGRATTRDLATTGGGAVGATGGAAAGFWVGASVGSFFPGPGTAIGSFLGITVGGIFGHYAGNKTTQYAIDKFYFGKQTEKEKQATIDALLSHYSSLATN
jgi:hypothetical protein